MSAEAPHNAQVKSHKFRPAADRLGTAIAMPQEQPGGDAVKRPAGLARRPCLHATLARPRAPSACPSLPPASLRRARCCPDAPPRPQAALRKIREGLWERVRGLEQSDPVLRRQPPAHAAAERPADKPWETREDFNSCVTPRLLRLAERYAHGGSVRCLLCRARGGGSRVAAQR